MLFNFFFFFGFRDSDVTGLCTNGPMTFLVPGQVLGPISVLSPVLGLLSILGLVLGLLSVLSQVLGHLSVLGLFFKS